MMNGASLPFDTAPLALRQRFALSVAPGQGVPAYEVPVWALTGQARRPRVVVTAGIHGDEFEGVRAVGRLLHELAPDTLRGALVLVPVAHPPAHAARTRTSPLDGADLNRTFPGDPDGTPTERLAAALLDGVVADADLLIDLHSGGTRYEFAPMVGFRTEPDTVAVASHAAAAAFGLPWLWQMGGDRGVFSYEASRRGMPCLGMEAGGRGGCRAEDVETMRAGVFNVLRHLGMLPGDALPPPSLPVYAGEWILSPATGLWDARVTLGETVAAGQLLAVILSPEGDTLAALHAPEAGFVGSIRTFCALDAGDWAITVMTRRVFL